MIHKIKLGCIADDFTGAGDAASFLAEGGLRTILVNGIPGEDFLLPDDCEAVVIALKSRTQKKEDAIRDSLAGIRWLAVHGTEKFYFKYCSTFDSTPEGNIGPVTDADQPHPLSGENVVTIAANNGIYLIKECEWR